ncbi:family 16 glycosylhydrolase [Methylobacterium sp. Leaf111]|uniref:family 16 glycosylhydrolase n=1 Tax=Methylobacterium sp. Leaf111 TaxID=1736257 RepID=UPI0009E93078|nr:family 16 glycosylhydrolase [Methylobacterium sp. Leaf111]
MALPVSGSPTNFVNATAGGQSLYGTDANDQLKTFFGTVGRSESWMYGGRGDDTYITLSSKDRVIENAGEGIDTVRTDWFYELSANVENITLTGSLSVAAKGNDLNNILIGNSARNVLEGGAGADEMTGGGGNDTFILSGNDVIKDYTAGDLLDLRGFTQYSTYAQVLTSMRQVGSDVVFQLTPKDVITVENTLVTQFAPSSFLLASDLSNYKLTFSDEFNSFSLNDGTNLDGTWYPLYPRTGLSAHTTPDKGSAQYFTYLGDDGSTGEQVGINPFSINDGVLTIEMKPIPEAEQYKAYGYDYSSGMINTASSFSQTYGYFEIRARLPVGQGLHDAFWMLPIDGNSPPEFDIVESIGRDPGHVANVAHAIDQGQKVAHSKTYGVDFTQFHTYGVDWEPDYITWYIDGVAVRTQPTPPGLDVPFYMLASLGGGTPYSGEPDATTPWPAHMDIDYIRAYASKNTVETGAPVDKVGTSGADTLYGTHLGDRLNGGLGDDKLYGGAGNDTLIGGGGNDELHGSFGDDTYVISATSEKVTEGTAKGFDTVQTALSSYTLGANLERLVYTGSSSFTGTGNTLNNVIEGGASNDTLNGGAGADVLFGKDGDDALNAGDGNDSVYGGTGIDTIRGNNGDDVLYGEDGNDLVKGDDGNDMLYGGAGDDNLQGAAGNDLLDGGIGRDRMSGGSGDDTYVVDQTSDTVTENVGEGVDTIRTNLAAYVLGANVENLIYTGSNAFTGTGNTLANYLSGGLGADVLTGGDGNDTYVINQAADVVVEQAGGGSDTVLTSLAKYTLGANVENLVYTGTSAFTGTGNGLSNAIQAGAGADRLDGQGGADIMTGGGGNDTYVVDNAGDAVVELIGQGTDRVLSKVSYTLAANVENLTLSTSAKIDGFGNALANKIVGNAGANVLDGRGGADTLTGGGGNDTFVFRLGETQGDKVTDFTGAGLAAGDHLEFRGFGTGATFTHAANSDLYTITADAAHGSVSETFQLVGVTNLDLLTGAGHNDVLLFA